MVVFKKRHVLIAIFNRRHVLTAIPIRRSACIAVFKEKTAEEKHVSFHIEVVLLENVNVSMILTYEDQPPFMDCLDSMMSLSQLGENDVHTGGPT